MIYMGRQFPPPPPITGDGSPGGVPPFIPEGYFSPGSVPFSPGFGAPSSPPPAVFPQFQTPPPYFDPRRIYSCLFRFTYVWLHNGQNYCIFPIFVSGNSVYAFRWTGRTWVALRINLWQIIYFQCFG
jgi:hypothetical protein